MNTMECDSDTVIKFTLECFLFKLGHSFKFFILFILFSLIISYTLVVNLVVLVSILLDKLANRLDICFISNAFSDLLIGVLVLPVLSIYSLFGYIPLSELYCSVWISLYFSINTASMLHFTYISYDRYLSVLKPVKYSSTNRHAITYLILFVLYAVSALCWMPLVYYHKSLVNSTKSPNLFSLNSNTNLTELNGCSFQLEPILIIPHSLVVYSLPMLFIITSYSRTIKMLNSKIRRRSSYNVSKISFSTTNNNKSNDDDLSDEKLSSFKKITRDFLKLTKSTSNHMRKSLNENESALANVAISNFIQDKNEDIADDEDQGNEEEEEEYIPDSISNKNNNKTIIIDSNSSLTRVKIYIKCKHFSDITLNNVNKIENLNDEEDYDELDKANLKEQNLLVKTKRTAHSLNEVDLLRIKHNNNNTACNTTNSTRAKSISDIRFNSSECTATTSKQEEEQEEEEEEEQLENKSNLFAHIKKMGKKTIQFASMQSIRKKLSFTQETDFQTQRRASEFVIPTVCQTRRKSLTQREKNITYKLGLIMVLVLVSWVPFAVLWPVSSLYLQAIPNSVYFFSLWLTYVNSLLSPLILISSNSKYSLMINLIKNVFYKK